MRHCVGFWQIGSHLVPGTTDWYNVKYDGDDEILSLNLLVDIDKGEILN